MKKNKRRIENKRKKPGGKRFVLSVILLTAVLLLGGSILGILIYMQLQGLLNPAIEVFIAFFDFNGFVNFLIVFWGLIIPLLLLVLLIINLVRHRKLKKLRLSWDEAMEMAIEAERAEFREEQIKKFSNRFNLGCSDVAYSGGNDVLINEINSLQEVCGRFREYAAANLGLYYSMENIREFIAGLAVSHIIILQGMSGTGKTSLAYAFGEFIGNSSTIIPIQPMWKERSDLLGYYNEFTKKYNGTVLFRKMYEANCSDKLYVTVLDEMNIARVEYYFAEFLSLLEIPNPELRYLEIVSDKWESDPEGLKDGRIKLPENMWFIGTTNNDDSTFSVSDKVYDRAMVVNLEKSAPFIASAPQNPAYISFGKFDKLINDSENGFEMTKRNERRLRELDGYLAENFQITFGNRIEKQIRKYIAAYVSCGGEESEALDDIISKKVLFKLRYRDLAQMRDEIENLIEFMKGLFGEDETVRCRKYLNNLLKNDRR